jgi:hypothetical protein
MIAAEIALGNLRAFYSEMKTAAAFREAAAESEKIRSRQARGFAA